MERGIYKMSMNSEFTKRTLYTAAFYSVLVLMACLLMCGENDHHVNSSKSDYIIYQDSLAPGFDLGVNTSGGQTDWVTVDSSGINMAYPGGQNWGAVFITVGGSTDPPRPGMDFSEYTRLSLDMRGSDSTENVWIGIKDNTDGDDGREARVRIYGITTDWENYELPLSQFYTADLDSIYIPIEFVFDGAAKTLCAKNIKYRH
jgi:hypothetical protein